MAPVQVTESIECPLEIPFSPRVTIQLDLTAPTTLNENRRRDLLRRVETQTSKGCSTFVLSFSCTNTCFVDVGSCAPWLCMPLAISVYAVDHCSGHS